MKYLVNLSMEVNPKDYNKAKGITKCLECPFCNDVADVIFKVKDTSCRNEFYMLFGGRCTDVNITIKCKKAE